MRYVLYHSNCYDGFGAAFAAWKRFGDDDTKYQPVSYGAPLPDMPDASEVLIVDFSYPEETIVALAHKAQVIVYDHHKTAAEALGGLARDTATGVITNPYVVFDMERSGAKLTWQNLHHGVPVPALIEHISDRDLWQFKLPGSAAIHKALVSYPMDFKLWDSFDVETLKTEGAALERLHAQLVTNTCKSAWLSKIGEHVVPIVNTSIAWSEVGHELLEKFPDAPFVASFTVFGDQVMWSLRSRPGFDVSAVAKQYGGGGHENAAGFKTVRP